MAVLLTALELLVSICAIVLPLPLVAPVVLASLFTVQLNVVPGTLLGSVIAMPVLCCEQIVWPVTFTAGTAFIVTADVASELALQHP